MSDKPIPKTKVSSRSKKPDTGFDIDVSLSGLGEDGTIDQRDAAAALAVGSKREDILSHSRNGRDVEKRIRQEIEWEADGEEETEMDIPALPPHPPIPHESVKEEDFEIRMIRFLDKKVQEAKALVQQVKNNPDARPLALTEAEELLKSHMNSYQITLEKMQRAASEAATDASLDDAFADIMDELNETGFEATGSPDDFPTQEQARAAERQDELGRIRELTAQMDMGAEEGEWVIRQAEHLKDQPDRKQVIDYLKRKQKEALLEFLKRKELERKTEQEAAIQEEIRRREEEERLKKEIGDFIMDTIVEGKGARIENLDAFERQGGKVYEPDSWGIRKIRWKGRFNALDGDNRLILPMIGQEWFDSLQEFHPWHYKKDPGASDFREKRLMAPVEKNGKNYFLTVDGELLLIRPPAADELKAFYKHKEAAEVSEKETIPEASLEHYVAYVQILAEELGAFAQRFEDADKQALIKLKDTILSVGISDKNLDWASVLASVKECVKKADLSPTVAFIKDRLFLRLAKTARAYDVELDFNGLAELDDYNWQPYGRYDQGVIVRFTREYDEKFTLIRDGKLLYAIDEALDEIEPFVGKVARVSGCCEKMKLYNFIYKENGELLREEWFKYIYPPTYGIFRIRTLDDRFNYLDSKTGSLICDTGYDEAGDFDKNGKALVKQGGEKFYIDREGSRLQPIQVAASMVVDRHFDTAKTGPIPTIDELKARIKERTREAKERHISHQLRSQFLEFIQAHPDSREELFRLFGKFRQEINRRAGRKLNGDKGSEDHLIRKLCGEVGQSGLKRKLKQELKDMVYNLRYKKPIWGKVEPLPVSFTVAFETLVRDHSEEEALLSLIMRLEIKMQQFSASERQSRLLREDLRKLIFRKEYKLSLKTRRAVYNKVLTMLNNPDIQWGGSSADRLAFKREYTEKQLVRLCAFAEGGRTDEAYEGFQKLLQRVSGHEKKVLKPLVLAFYQYLYQLSERYHQGDRNPKLVAQYKEVRRKTIDILHQAYNQDPDDTQIRQVIDWLQLPKKPALPPVRTEKKIIPPAPVAVKRKRSRLWVKLVMLGLAAGGMALFIDSHIERDGNPGAKKPAATRLDKGEKAKALSKLAEMYVKNGKWMAAKDIYLKMLKLEPKNAGHHAHYGQLLIKINNLEGAEWHLNRALELDPANKLARHELKKLKANGIK